MSTSPVKAKTTEPANRHFMRRTQTARQPTILVAEDHDDTREMLHMLLEIWGCRVVEARDGLEAVAAASRERPELILMDGSLPFLDGLQATRRIRENGLGDQVKILALDGWGTPSYHAAALAAGCDDIIKKPLDFDRLRNYLTPIFDNFGSRGEANALTPGSCEPKICNEKDPVSFENTRSLHSSRWSS